MKISICLIHNTYGVIPFTVVLILGYLVGYALVGIKLPRPLISSFTLLGKATGGVVLFASGIILFSYKVVFNKSVLAIGLSKSFLCRLLYGGILALIFSPSISKKLL